MLLFDTMILIDYLNGVRAARKEIETSADRAVSIVTWIEVLVGEVPEYETIVRHFLSSFEILPLSGPVTEQTIVLRRTTRLKPPDAMILATAQVAGRVLVTRNTRDFSEHDPMVRIPYRM